MGNTQCSKRTKHFKCVQVISNVWAYSELLDCKLDLQRHWCENISHYNNYTIKGDTTKGRRPLWTKELFLKERTGPSSSYNLKIYSKKGKGHDNLIQTYPSAAILWNM